MSIVFNGKKLEIPGFNCVSYLDKGVNFKQSRWKTPRKEWIRGIVVHTNRGMVPDKVLPGGPNEKRDIALATFQGNSDRKASWDFTVDFDGTVACSNDVCSHYTWHANTVNRFTTGIEICQGTNKPWTIYEDSLDGAVLLIDILTNRLGIQRQILCWDSDKDSWIENVIPNRIQHPNDGTSKRTAPTGNDCVGIYGHRNVTTNKGPGDPGNAIFDKLREAGYELFDARKKQDLEIWKSRQEQLGIPKKDIDGVAGPQTRHFISLEQKKNNHHITGLYVCRPIDEILCKMDNDNNS